MKVRKVEFTMRLGIYVLTSMFESHDPLQCFLGSRWYNQGGSTRSNKVDMQYKRDMFGKGVVSTERIFLVQLLMSFEVQTNS